MDISNGYTAESIEAVCVEQVTAKKERRKHVWKTEAFYDDLDEAADHITSEGFVLHNNLDLKIGQKFHYRCKNVPSDKKPWCNRQYILFSPSDRLGWLVQHNNMEHNCHELMRGVKKRMSEEMQNYIFGLFEKGTQRISSVLAHVLDEIKKNDEFSAEEMPKKRQIEYLLQKYRNSKVKPLFQLGDLIDWCDVHSSFPKNNDEVFVLAHECSPLGEGMKFRFVLSTPEMLRRDILGQCVLMPLIN